jgi:D-alanyl-D-alanine carboxypeptidase (penicillin-binding protein 5/6)
MRRGHKFMLVSLLVLVLLAGAYILWSALRTSSPLRPVLNASLQTSYPTVQKLSWPTSGQSAVGILNSKVLDTHGIQTPVPTASTAKLITALMVLKAKPLSVGQQGPTITLGPSDLAIYNAYVAEQGSVVQVQSGEQISEYQMLEAMLLPSANNMADSLAIWAYGTLANYSEAANNYIHGSLGLDQTTVGSDASGFLPSTTSTASDLVKLGEDVMNNPLLAGIVSQTSAAGIPVVSTVKNVNSLIGQDNIIGIKTGNTNQAGGVFVGAANADVNGKTVTIVTANAGSPTLKQSLLSSQAFIQSSEANFVNVSMLKAGGDVASYKAPWKKYSVNAVNDTDFTVSVWGGSTVTLNFSKLNNLMAPASYGESVGVISAQGDGIIGKSSLKANLASRLESPSLLWKLNHP